MKLKYTDEMIEFLKKIAFGKTYEEIVEIFNKKYDLGVTIKNIKSLFNRKKIKIGRKATGGSFKKGLIPWNKGLKTGLKHDKQFKKGIIPWNKKEFYSERVDKNGYILIKIPGKKEWILKHRWLWEQKYGEIPEGYHLIFANKDKRNFDLDNLILVSKAELAILVHCRLISSIPELTKTGLNIAKIKAKLNEIRKRKENK